MIEIAPRQYQIICSYEDAIIYCFSLEIDGKTGWRLPTRYERNKTKGVYGWYKLESNTFLSNISLCTPVRDI